jgi:hypothetical protein
MRYRLVVAAGYGAILVVFAYDDNAPSWVEVERRSSRSGSG